jgi:pimeloyl-ACP methyl ester carboxylesterase
MRCLRLTLPPLTKKKQNKQRAAAAPPSTQVLSRGAPLTPSTAFMPAELSEITEPAAIAMAERYVRAPLRVPSLPVAALDTAFVPPARSSSGTAAAAAAPPVVLLHGFDSSSLEMRRLLPLLETEVEAHALDLVGWGFTDHSMFSTNPDLVLTPAQKAEHLHAYWRTQLGGRPMALVGASLGGAVALDFALTYPEAVDRLILIDGQGFIDGIGPMASLPRPVAAAGVWVLRTKALRMAANKMAYHDPAFATEDAMRVGRLHTHLGGWSDANVAWMRGGGYSLSARLSGVRQPVRSFCLW